MEPDQRITQILEWETEADLVGLLAESATNHAQCFQIPLLRLRRVAEQMDAMLSQALKGCGYQSEQPIEWLCSVEMIDLLGGLMKEHSVQLSEDMASIVTDAREICEHLEHVLSPWYIVAEGLSVSELTHLSSDAVASRAGLGLILQMYFPKIGQFDLPRPLSWMEIYECIGLRHGNN
jgi:hypothetical protein